jgi:hypothetical protein
MEQQGEGIKDKEGKGEDGKIGKEGDKLKVLLKER